MKDLEMNELMEIDGGWIPAFISIATACIYVYNNWDDFCEGFERGYNS